ncbi:MAG: hypothetical protein KH372_01335 [Olsenella uli]|uniref:hypothetical protein n=1 Tax=Olsenella uli TaxID=133926 RepID=UPI001D5695CF|nr:hypothetical protein [Olsenella uli]MBS6417458.1 hypothetical protein [Olsenella uli]
MTGMGPGRAGRHHFQRRVGDTADGPTVARPHGIRRASSCAPAAIVAAMLKGAEERARELCAMQANLSGNDKDALDAYERDFIGRFAHSSSAIEGSALSPIETQLVPESRHEVAQRPPCAGSSSFGRSPILSTRLRGVAQLGSASALGEKGR